MPSEYLTDRALAARFGISRVSVWRWVHTEGFPQPVKLSPGVTRWRESDVLNWEASRKPALATSALATA